MLQWFPASGYPLENRVSWYSVQQALPRQCSQPYRTTEELRCRKAKPLTYCRKSPERRDLHLGLLNKKTVKQLLEHLFWKSCSLLTLLSWSLFSWRLQPDTEKHNVIWKTKHSFLLCTFFGAVARKNKREGKRRSHFSLWGLDNTKLSCRMNSGKTVSSPALFPHYNWSHNKSQLDTPHRIPFSLQWRCVLDSIYEEP